MNRKLYRLEQQPQNVTDTTPTKKVKPKGEIKKGKIVYFTPEDRKGSMKHKHINQVDLKC